MRVEEFEELRASRGDKETGFYMVQVYIDMVKKNLFDAKYVEFTEAFNTIDGIAEQKKELVQWLASETRGPTKSFYLQGYSGVIFLDAEDAVHFKLRWGCEIC